MALRSEEEYNPFILSKCHLEDPPSRNTPEAADGTPATPQKAYDIYNCHPREASPPPAAHAKVDSFASTLKVLESTQIRNVSVRDICTMLILWPRILFFLTSCPVSIYSEKAKQRRNF